MERSERVGRAVYALMVAVEPEDAPGDGDYDAIPEAERAEFENLVAAVAGLWDALAGEPGLPQPSPVFDKAVIDSELVRVDRIMQKLEAGPMSRNVPNGTHAALGGVRAAIAEASKAVRA